MSVVMTDELREKMALLEMLKDARKMEVVREKERAAARAAFAEAVEELGDE